MTEKRQRFDVATIGNYTKDTIVTAAGTTHADGGGVNYSANAALALGRKVAAVMRLAAEDFHVVRALEDVGITVFATATPSSTLMRLEYPTDNPDERILTVADHAGSFTPEQVRAIDAAAFIISPSFRGEMPVETVRALREKGAMISADAQGFIRHRHPDGRLEHLPWPEQGEVLGLIDVLKADVVEAEAMTGEADIRKSAEILAAQGPREVIITHRDGIVLLANGQIFEAEFHAESMLGRSGRGDTCVGSYVAARLEHPPEEALRWSVATTSLKIAVPGPIRRPYSDIVDVVNKYYRGVTVPETA
ncbi:MAG: PfkB family carbohydrate kinase [Thermoanaerobaculales bacterium]|jgi:sugar/nucleoside kinase (ribokinase family)|nr:PfkB family carbohydrate kinase [Thermoanaerobaculales bacterium]